MPPLGSSTVVCLQQCRSMSFVLFLLFFHTLLHVLVVDPLQYSPAIFCSVVLLIFSRLDSTDVLFRSVCRPSFVTHAQAILIACVWSCSCWTLLCPLSDCIVCDPVFLRYPHNFSEPAIFTGIKPILRVFGESTLVNIVDKYICIYILLNLTI